jgi:hypothetical protein
MHRRVARHLLVGLASTLLVAACGDAAIQAGTSTSAQGSALSQQAPGLAPAAGPLLDGHASVDRSAANGAPAPVPAAGAPAAAGSAGAAEQKLAAGAGAPSAPLDLGTAQGRIERSVSAQYVVPHGGFLTAFDAVVQRATALGGFVISSTTAPDSDGRIASGTVSVKVPAAKLSDLIAGLPSDFTVSSLNYGSQDHTAQTVDLTARVSAATAQRAALLALLDHARSIADITSLEQQIAQVQLQIDQDQGSLNAVNASVELATASIGLTEKGAKAAPPPPSHSEPALLHALRAGADNALQLVAGGVLGAITVLPLLVLLAFAAWLGRRHIRRLFQPGPPA